MTDEKKQEEQQEVPPVSRVVIEFVGPGMADVKRAEFENITLGQMLMLPEYVQWQTDNAKGRFNQQQAKGAERNKIVVAKMARAKLQ